MTQVFYHCFTATLYVECKDIHFPGFSGRICCFWQGISGRSFSGMGNLKKLYGQQANCSGIYSGIFCP
jgi:hypothetical protein